MKGTNDSWIFSLVYIVITIVGHSEFLACDIGSVLCEVDDESSQIDDTLAMRAYTVGSLLPRALPCDVFS